jgi:hypothetical protein
MRFTLSDLREILDVPTTPALQRSELPPYVVTPARWAGHCPGIGARCGACALCRCEVAASSEAPGERATLARAPRAWRFGSVEAAIVALITWREQRGAIRGAGGFDELARFGTRIDRGGERASDPKVRALLDLAEVSRSWDRHFAQRPLVHAQIVEALLIGVPHRARTKGRRRRVSVWNEGRVPVTPVQLAEALEMPVDKIRDVRSEAMHAIGVDLYVAGVVGPLPRGGSRLRAMIDQRIEARERG